MDVDEFVVFVLLGASEVLNLLFVVLLVHCAIVMNNL